MKTVGKILCGFGRGLRIGLVAIGALAFTGSVIAVADYTATQGTGITFASIVISTKHYFANVICDATIGETQCQAVNSSGQASVLEANSASILSAVQAAIPAGANLIGKTGIDQTTNGSTNGVVNLPATSGGLTSFFVQPTASDNHTNVKNGAGQVYWVFAENNSATVNYLRFYNAATGFNGCNSATNLITQVQIPASTSVGGVSIPLPFGIPFSTGISICVTSGYATNDTTNATATAISLTIGYD